LIANSVITPALVVRDAGTNSNENLPSPQANALADGELRRAIALGLRPLAQDL
jgi:hypothetical protein